MWSRIPAFVSSRCFWQDSDLRVLSSALLSRAPRFRRGVVCSVVKDLVCLSELSLIPMLSLVSIWVVRIASMGLRTCFSSCPAVAWSLCGGGDRGC